MEVQKYFVVEEGKPQGPFTLLQLKEKNITLFTFIKTPLMDDFKEAHELPEIRELFSFQKQFTSPQYFAGFDLRMLANAIDWFIWIAIIAVIDLILIINKNENSNVMLLIMVSCAMLPILKLLYHIIMEIANQATIGKRLMNIKVTNLYGQTARKSQIIYRNLFKMISTVLLFGGYFYLFLNKRQQTLHDHISDCLVIKDRLI